MASEHFGYFPRKTMSFFANPRVAFISLWNSIITSPLTPLYFQTAGRVGRQVYFINTSLVLIMTFLLYFVTQMLIDVQVTAELSESPFWAVLGVRVVPIILLGILYVTGLLLIFGWLAITAKRIQDIGLLLPVGLVVGVVSSALWIYWLYFEYKVDEDAEQGTWIRTVCMLLIAIVTLALTVINGTKGDNKNGKPADESLAELSKVLPDKVFALGLVVSCAAVFFMAWLVTINVLLRKILDWSIDWNVEMVQYMMVVLTFAALAHTLRVGRHITIDFFTNRLPAKVQDYLEVVMIGGSFLFTFIFMLRSYHSVERAYGYGTQDWTGILQAKIWIPMTALPAGLALLAIALLIVLVEKWDGMFFGRKVEEKEVVVGH